MRYDCSQYLVSFVSSHHHLFSFIPTSPLLSYSYIFVLFKDPKNPSHLSDLGFEILCWSPLGSPAMTRLIIVTPQFPESNRSCQFNMSGGSWPLSTSIVGSWQIHPCAGKSSCSEFLIGMTVSCSEDGVLYALCLPFGSYILSCLLPQCSLSDANILFQHSRFPCSQHLELFCVPSFITIYFKMRPLWLKLRVTVLYSHNLKYLEGNLRLCLAK